MMNLLSTKQKSINNNMLNTSLQRDIEYALGKKPSLDGLAKIHHTPVDGPFMGLNNLKLGKEDIKVENIIKQNGIVEGQIGILHNEVLNSNTVEKIVEMKYENNNGVTNGYIRKASIQPVDDNRGSKVNINEEVVNIPTEEKVINSYIINLDVDNNDSLSPSATWEPSTPSPSPSMINNKLELEEEVYHGVKTLEPRNNKNIQDKSSLDRSFEEILGKFRTNKIILVLFIVIILVVIFLIKCKK